MTGSLAAASPDLPDVPRCRVGRSGYQVSVYSPFPEGFRAYAQVVYPPYLTVDEPEGTPKADVRVALHEISADRLRRWQAEIADTDGMRLVPLERRRTGYFRRRDGLREVADLPGDFVYRSDPVAGRVDVWGHDRQRLLLEGTRLTRTLVVGLLVSEGGCVPLHASCVAIGDRAVVFTGSSGAGKTTSAIAAMRMLGARFISNDLLLLCPGEAGVVALGIPLQVRMAAGTVQGMGLLPHLDPYHEVFPFIEARDWAERERKIEISAARLASWFGQTPCASAPVGHLIWPHLSEGDGVRLLQMGADETAERLRGVVTCFDPAWPTWSGIGYQAPLPLPAAAENLVEECAKHEGLELFGARSVTAAMAALAAHLGIAA